MLMLPLMTSFLSASNQLSRWIYHTYIPYVKRETTDEATERAGLHRVHSFPSYALVFLSFISLGHAKVALYENH